MNQFLVLCVFAFSLALVSTTSIIPGQCPKPTQLAQPFDLNQYLGTWYEIQSTNPLFEYDLRCIKNNFTFDSYGSIVANLSAVNSNNETISDVANLIRTGQDNVLGIGYPLLTSYVQYWVVDTDYTSYSLVVSCTNTIYDFYDFDVLILSRKPTLDVKIVDNLVTKLESVGINGTEFIETGTNCFD